MTSTQPLTRELVLALKFAGVSVIGFLADYGAFRLCHAGGMSAALARLIALLLAMHVTFGLTRWLVFSRHGDRGLAAEWGRFMLANGFGGGCNYLMFVALAATKWPFVSGMSAAFMIAGGTAYVINYAGVRLFVYGQGLAQPAASGGGDIPPQA